MCKSTEDADNSRSVIHGELEAFFEMGSDGIHWALYEDGKTGYDGLHFLADGDYLTIYGDDGGIIRWEGVINLEWKTGWKRHRYYPKPGKQSFWERLVRWLRYLFGPEYGQQFALGRGVHGNQYGFDIDDWAALFFRNLYDDLPSKDQQKWLVEKIPAYAKVFAIKNRVRGTLRVGATSASS